MGDPTGLGDIFAIYEIEPEIKLDTMLHTMICIELI